MEGFDENDNDGGGWDDFNEDDLFDDLDLDVVGDGDAAAAADESNDKKEEAIKKEEEETKEEIA
eukprot:5286830-Ditylum_brightwellii.AAC.1